MDSLQNILGSKDFTEPPEHASIKKYVMDEFAERVGVQVREREVVITVPSAALASTLRLRSPDIKRRCAIKKRLVFQVGGY